MRKYKASQEEVDILQLWYELKMNAKGLDPQTGFYLSGRKTHTGLMCINAENLSVKQEKIQIEINLPMQLWHLAETAPGSRINRATRLEQQYIKKHKLVRSTRKQMTAQELRDYNMLPPKGIRFGGFRSIKEAATMFKAWMDQPVLFVEAIREGSGGQKYYL